MKYVRILLTMAMFICLYSSGQKTFAMTEYHVQEVEKRQNEAQIVATGKYIFETYSDEKYLDRNVGFVTYVVRVDEVKRGTGIQPGNEITLKWRCESMGIPIEIGKSECLNIFKPMQPVTLYMNIDSTNKYSAVGDGAGEVIKINKLPLIWGLEILCLGIFFLLLVLISYFYFRRKNKRKISIKR